MPLTITFQIMGDVVLSRGLSRWGENIQNFTEVWVQIQDDFFQIEREQFSSQGGRSGTPWAPLSLSYGAWKAKYFPGQPILQLTGAMANEMTGGLVSEITERSLRMYPTLPYPAYHQRGNPRLPVRPVVQLTEDDKMRWMKLIHRFVYEKAREEGLV